MGLHFLYSCINTLILAAIIFLVGRKAIAKMFRTRRERICRELDELEQPPVLPELPTPAPEAEAAEAAELLKRCMESVMRLEVPLKTDITMGGDWRACK